MIPILCSRSKEDVVKYQPAYRCSTCSMTPSETICGACARNCHAGHNVEYIGELLCTCDCCFLGDGICKCNDRQSVRLDPSYKCTYKGQSYDEQPTYKCKTCFPGENGNTICERCARICHRGHELWFVGNSSCDCDCPCDVCPIDCHLGSDKLRNFVYERKNVEVCERNQHLRCMDEGKSEYSHERYSCDTCGAKFVCKACALKNHIGHKIKCLGTESFLCGQH